MRGGYVVVTQVLQPTESQAPDQYRLISWEIYSTKMRYFHPRARSSIFGGAKPVDTTSREKEIEAKIKQERQTYGTENER